MASAADRSQHGGAYSGQKRKAKLFVPSIEKNKNLVKKACVRMLLAH
jgi:hypothetical protein